MRKYQLPIFSDTKLLYLIQVKDDYDAFTEIYNRYWKTLINTAYQRLRTVMQGPIYTVDASAGISNISTTNGHINKYPKTVIEQRFFNNPKFYAWPIPQSVIDNSKGILTQNPLWK